VRNLRQEDFKLYRRWRRAAARILQVGDAAASRAHCVVFAWTFQAALTAEEMERLRGALNAVSAQLSDHPALYCGHGFRHERECFEFTSKQTSWSARLERIAREPMDFQHHTYDAVDDAIRLLGVPPRNASGVC